ncbi:MAG: hypothetical protein GY696_07960 [Gammaproteobacteria bacterium]|nr:hypothetical protein [Gammaproteobacteria bacterium]
MDVNELHETVESELYRYQNLKVATAFQQSSVNAPPSISAQPYIVHERFDPRDLPTFDRKETSYASFKQAFLDRTSNMGMHDSRKKHLLARPEVMKDKMTREAIQNLEPKEQWEHLEFITVAAIAGKCPRLAAEDLGKVLCTSDLPKTD